jgi:hypothetical protein
MPAPALPTASPLLANMVEGGKTPVQSAASWGARGFRIVIFPRRHRARRRAHLAGLLRQSSPATRPPRPGRRQMLDFDGLNALIGTPELLEAGAAVWG